MKRAAAAVITALIFVLSFSVGANAADLSAVINDNLDEVYERTAAALLNKAEENGLAVDMTGGEWAVIGLERGGFLTPELAAEYIAEVEKTVSEKGSAKLNSVKSTENSRVVLALTALGADAKSVSGYDLLEPLEDFEYIKKQGINGAVWTLLAFDSHGYEPSGGQAQNLREDIIAYILEKQFENGGWGLGDEAEADVTAMAIQALAPYYKTDERVTAAVDEALSCLSEMQNDDGTFTNMGVTNCESVAQVIAALTALGIDPVKEESFIKNGCTLIDALLAFSTENGFKHTLTDTDETAISTEQGFYAMVAYYRFSEGKTSLFDMSDVEITASEQETVQPDESSGPSESSVSESGETSQSNVKKADGSQRNLAVTVVLWAVIAGCAGFLGIRVIKGRKGSE